MSEIHVITERVRTKVIQTTEYAHRYPNGIVIPVLFADLLTFEEVETLTAAQAKHYPGLQLLTRAVFRSEWTEVPA